MVNVRNLTGWQLSFIAVLALSSGAALLGAVLGLPLVAVLGVVTVMVANSCYLVSVSRHAQATKAECSEYFSRVKDAFDGELVERLDRRALGLEAELRSMMDATLASVCEKQAQSRANADALTSEVLKLNESVEEVSNRLEQVQKRVLNRLRNVLSPIESSLSTVESELSTIRGRQEASERRLLSTIEAERLLAQERFEEMCGFDLGTDIATSRSEPHSSGHKGPEHRPRSLDATESHVFRSYDGDEQALTEPPKDVPARTLPHSALIYETRESLTSWVRDALKENRDQFMSLMEKALRNETRQVEALWQLMPLVETCDILPPFGRWAMDARSLLHLMNLVKTYRPKNVLEIGGGTSTVWLGYACKEYGGTIVSIDHDEYFSASTQLYVSKHRLVETVKTRTAPLEAVEVHGTNYYWYSNEFMGDLTDIDMLIVDGPPGNTGREARLPALPLLEEYLSDDCLVILDDTQRDDEKRIIDQWQLFYPDFERVDEDISRLGVLRRQAGWSAEA